MSEPQIRLYGPRLAPFVEKVSLALGLKKLAYELVEPAGPEDYRRWNPETGLLPVMDLGGSRIIDSARILDALDARYPEPPLQAADPRVASRQRQLEAWVGETFFFYWVNYLRTRESAEDEAAPQPGRLARLGILRRPAAIRGRSDGPGLGREFGQRIEDLASFLGPRPFFYANRISRADLAVYAFLHRDLPGGERLMAAHPSLTALMRRVEQETTAPSL